MRDICTRLRIPRYRINARTDDEVIEDNLPQPIKDAEIIYAEVSLSKLRALAKMIGGVIRPASIARAC